jgi:hypothetical protein
MSEHEKSGDFDSAETIDDLDVPEGQQEGVAGGIKGESTTDTHKDHIDIDSF